MPETTTTPAKAWQEMVRGNERFIAGEPRHPRQDVERRGELIGTQAPHAVLFGCSDSRLAAEIIFDKGLGDLFVIRNAGQVISDSVIGSIEYAVAILGVPLIVVLGHDECGAVAAAIDSQKKDAPAIPPHIRHLIEPITAAVGKVKATLPAGENPDPTVVGREHLRATIATMVAGSELMSDAIAAGTLAIVGANYRLLEGMAIPDVVIGDIRMP
ncbi:carbonic anhydrase [Cryobacterium mesophilum]|uniref:Carbonic anhydrase n=1 Tax=Terrimesophilobacter mesophilus TaxID=433647 RepID=A0A4V3I9R0_9MICO|nr:carbonic anhydrase [Terrimesophilobacter mesophilus]MBB5633779.1 carbonic anhydrase [Terrimesophilobacter mesophilus]TFB80458.1 carbonic anhydrase [Terrimesophilobacter mesophilus]